MSNPRVRMVGSELLSDNWYLLKKHSFDYQRRDGTWQRQSREAYDRGNGACILLFNQAKQTVLLTRQFRLPTYLNGNADGMLIEVCAGLLDADDPLTCVKRETEEETGYRVHAVRKLFQAYMSPGAVTEVIHFFAGEYRDDDKVSEGGGHEHEGEDIEVLELPFGEALAMVASGAICDAKTILLLQYAQLHGLLG